MLSFITLGYKLMKQSGWDGKSGLGTEEHKGRLFPVKSVLKRDRAGIQVRQILHYLISILTFI